MNFFEMEEGKLKIKCGSSLATLLGTLVTGITTRTCRSNTTVSYQLRNGFAAKRGT